MAEIFTCVDWKWRPYNKRGRGRRRGGGKARGGGGGRQ